jgi:signal transduction histidine kinase
MPVPGNGSFQLPDEWKVLIVDDDPIMHKATSLAFKNFIFGERKIKLLHAYTSAEAIAILQQEEQLAVVIVDVVMETEVSGFELVNYIRNDLANATLRIILRTAQPDFAPQIKIVIDYDIQEYINKQDFSFEKLKTTVTLALKTWCELEKVKFLVYQKHKEVAEKQEELQVLLKKLENAQNRLLMAEKISTLGYLVASVTHELNSPASVVLSNIRYLNSLLTQTFSSLPEFIQFTQSLPEVQPFLAFLMQAINNNHGGLVSAKTERELRRQLEKKLTEHNITNAINLAHKLTLLGIYEISNELLCFLQIPQATVIIDALVPLGRIRNSVQLIDIAANRVLLILQTLKQFSYLQEDAPVLTDLAEHLDGVLLLFKHIFPATINVDCLFQPTAQVPIIASQLIHVWTNLINNALYAMGESGTLTIKLYPYNQEYAAVEVCDTGSGILPENVPKLFEPFFTTKKFGEGTGIGLDISKKIIEKHKGQIWVQSEPGNTVFRVLLPFAVSNERHEP